MTKTYTLDELASHVGATVHGDGGIEVHAVATLQSAQSGQIAFLSNAKYQKFLAETSASAVLLSPADVEGSPVPALSHDNPYLAFALIAQLLDSTPDAATGIAVNASVDATAQVGENVKIGPNAVIGANVILEDGVQIGAGAVIGQGSHIQQDTRIWANVTLYHNIQIGRDCIIHSGAIIGADGFGFANDKGNWIKIPQTGRVVIGNNTEIGASTTIDRGAIEDTVIGNNVIIDNQCQIGHNAIVGDHCAIAGCTVLAGSCELGKYVVVGGASGINGHIKICQGAQITGFSMVTQAITEPGTYSSGIPVEENRSWNKKVARLRQLDKFFGRVKDLDGRLKKLEQLPENKE